MYKKKDFSITRKISNILSLFDGMSCGQIALNRVGIKYDNYFSSEIDKHAIKVTQYNYPQTIQLGDITKLNNVDLPMIDLMMGGSPCQGFSFSGKQMNFNDPRSKLFFEFVRLIKECKPKYWFLENVVMKKEYENIITEYLGVKPVTINSKLVSAQNRERLYWANFKIEQPLDNGILLIDILEDNLPIGSNIINKQMLNKATIVGRRLNDKGKREDYNKNIPITQCIEVRETNMDKCNCLTTVKKDNVLTTLPIGRHPDVFKNRLPFRYYTVKEYCRLQTVPEDYFDDIVSENQIMKMIGNGWTVDIITHVLKELLKHEYGEMF
jgi:DNA-cytosine methyltransferase